MKKPEPCARCGNKEPSVSKCFAALESCDIVCFFECACGEEGPKCVDLKSARKAWNKQQRVAQQREWPYTIRKEIVFLYRTIGRQKWLDCLEDKDVIEIRDHIMPVFEKHLELRKLEHESPEDEVVRMKPHKPGVKLGEIEIKVLADNSQQLVEILKLRQRIQQLERDFEQERKENKQLRQQIRQAVIYFQQLETQLDQSLALAIVGGVDLEQVG